jgi:hypothetical protein
MAHHEYAAEVTHTKHYEAIFLSRMPLIVELHGVFIEEHRFRLFEQYAVLLLVGTALRVIPLERDCMYSVCTESQKSTPQPPQALTPGLTGQPKAERLLAQQCRRHAQEAA